MVAKMGKIPDKSLFNSNSPTKRDQRKVLIYTSIIKVLFFERLNIEIYIFILTILLIWIKP